MTRWLLAPFSAAAFAQHVVDFQFVTTRFRACQSQKIQKSFQHLRLDTFLTVPVERLWKTQWNVLFFEQAQPFPADCLFSRHSVIPPENHPLEFLCFQIVIFEGYQPNLSPVQVMDVLLRARFRPFCEHHPQKEGFVPFLQGYLIA
jgi:hypothetical protein